MIDVVTKKPSAMKIMSSVTSEEKEMALNEIKFLKSLNHKNIVKFEEEYHESESVIIVMEYCRGGDLASVIRKHIKLRIPFSEETIIFWFYDLLSAMAYLHKKDILHRDLKHNGNIFLTSSNSLKFGDFGFAKSMNGNVENLCSL